MKKAIVEWLIKKFLPGFHLHRDPIRKASDFIAPPPEFTTEGGEE